MEQSLVCLHSVSFSCQKFLEIGTQQPGTSLASGVPFLKTSFSIFLTFAACTDHYKHDPFGKIVQVPRGIHNQYHQRTSRDCPHYETLWDHDF